MTPPASFVSKSSGCIPSGSSQSKQCRRFARVSSTPVTPRFIPGQILRPDEKGMYWKSCPLKWRSLSSKRSGQNTSGSFQNLGSLIIAHTFVITVVLAGIS
ncbi:unnamed protein product [Spirodela intermedia]|uniref:Uncharacterized protein n=1 Tax=Spirodela intermedia TaxID=51605 RepID=A0ABN7E829_SPIIN|nr:unnamed protein product [Spirodela intermedia]